MLFGKHKDQTPFVAAIVPAAGASRRMGGENKLLMDLLGQPVLIRTLAALEASPLIGEIVLAAPEDLLETYGRLAKEAGISKLTKVVVGGETRQESVYRAAVQADPRARFLAVHDGDRPLVAGDLIDRVCRAAFAHTAAAPGVPVQDTVKQVDREDHIHRTVDREALRAIQTPQVADRDLLTAALQAAIQKKQAVTDECAALEGMGVRPVVVPGSFENRKITTPIDLVIARAILAGREGR